MRAIAMIKNFFNIECDVMSEGREIALNDAIERAVTMRIAYAIDRELKTAQAAQERYNELAK
tara:strand:- start:301 stop:486 length:186 start_codon:yes stop_codon:yes gene_type:complete